MRRQDRRQSSVLRSAAAAIILLLALLPVLFAAYRGATLSARSAESDARVAGARQERGWRCVEREIRATVPAGAEVLVPMDQPLLPYQRAMELVAPRARTVARQAQADMELRLVRAARHGTCQNFRVQVRHLR